MIFNKKQEGYETKGKNYYDYLKEYEIVLKKSSVRKNIFNPLKLKEQFLQVVSIFDEYFLLHFRDKVTLCNIFDQVGMYTLYFASRYSNSIKKIYVIERDEKSYNALREILNFDFPYYNNKIIPVFIGKENALKTYKSESTLNKKFDVLMFNSANILYQVNGDWLGISQIFDFLSFLKKHANSQAMFSCLAFSIGKRKIEKGGVILGNLPIYDYQSYNQYRETLEKIFKEWSVKFFVLSPGSWVGFKSNYDIRENYISLKEYCDIFSCKIDPFVEKYIQSFDKKARFVHNIYIVGLKGRYHNHFPVLIKNIDTSYLREVMKLELICWPKNLQASEQNIKSRLTYFPEGCVGAFTLEGKLIGFATSQRINFIPFKKVSKIEKLNWMKLDSVAEANILETCDMNGNALHLVSACVLPEYRGKGIWKDFIVFRIRLAKLLNLRYVVILTRLNLPNKMLNYDEILNYAEISDDYYIKTLKKFGFTINGIIEKPDDVESAGHWVLMYKDLKK